ncbi:arginase, putative [Plasmodium ovale]|uniref:Arginase, putative n=1 Tax=Plasmodium ovale TaxID=36330 RepID=A0A1C3KQ90_PLAOA|nr:arginase, putative [Plasmodium ovale]
MFEYIENYIKNYEEEKNLYVQKNVSIIGSPMSAGQPLGGVHLACDDLRKNGLHNVIEVLGWGYEDVGNIERTEEDEETEDTEVTEKTEETEETVETNEQEYPSGNVQFEGYDDVKKQNGNILARNCNGEQQFRSVKYNPGEPQIINVDECISKKCVQSANYYSNIKNVEMIGKFSEKLFRTMSNELRKKNFVLNIGGDHGVAFSSILSSLQIYKNLRVIWIDAHGDINIPETSPSGNYHGMTLAHALGLFKKKVPCFEWSENLTYLKPENVAIIGLRDIDTYEKIILKKCNINYYTMFDIDKNGIYNIICTALNKVDPHENCPIHISLDIDSVDHFFAPGTGTIAKGGLNYREINLLMKVLADTKRIVSMDLVEYNPSLDETDKTVHGDSLPIAENATKTGKLCLELIARVLGHDIV